MLQSSSPHLYTSSARVSGDLFSDGRTHSLYSGSSRQARIQDVAKNGWIAQSEDGTSCVVAGHAALHVVRITNSLTNGTTVELAANLGNMWWSSAMTNEKSPTDVVWCHGNWNNKILTSSRQGDLFMWDINKSGASKLEQRLQPSAPRRRAITKLAYSQRSNNLIAAGAADGFVHVWDFRHLDTPVPLLSLNASNSNCAVRALVLSPVASEGHLAVVALDNGTLQRWDLRSPSRPLDTVRVAHASAVLGMDWLPPGPNIDRGHGWLATAGMDKTVKIWDLGGATLPTLPMRTLHASYPVRQVFFRPKHDTEVILLPATEHDSVEIWDIRREWLPKWTLQHGGEGGIHDIVPANGHLLWAVHANGAFVQHDLRSSSSPSIPPSRPSSWSSRNAPSDRDRNTYAYGLKRSVDDIPRGTVTWDPSGNIAFIAHHEERFEMPYDDVHPDVRPLIATRGMRYKFTNDRALAGLPSSQTLATTAVPTADGFHVHGVQYTMDLSVGRDRVCELNAQIAADAGQWRAAQTWEMLRSLLADLHPPETPMPSPPPPTRPQSPVVSKSPDPTSLPFMTPSSKSSPIVARKSSHDFVPPKTSSPKAPRRPSPIAPKKLSRRPSPEIVKTPIRAIHPPMVHRHSPEAGISPGLPFISAIIADAMDESEGEAAEKRDSFSPLSVLIRRERGDSATSSIPGNRRDSGRSSRRDSGEHDEGFIPPTSAMLERRSSVVSFLSDSSSSRGSIAPSLRSPLTVGTRPPGSLRRPSIAAPATSSIDHSYSAPVVMTLAVASNPLAANSTASLASVGSPAISSLLRHQTASLSSSGRTVSAPMFYRHNSSRSGRSGGSTPNSSNPNSPLRLAMNIPNESLHDNQEPLAKSVSEPTISTMPKSPSESTFASRPRPLVRGRRVSLRGSARPPETFAYESASFADAEQDDDDGSSSSSEVAVPCTGTDSDCEHGKRMRRTSSSRRRPARPSIIGGRRPLTKQESRASIRTVVASSPQGSLHSDHKTEPDIGTSVETSKVTPPTDAAEPSSSLGLELGELILKRDQSLAKTSQEQVTALPKLEASALVAEDTNEDTDSVNEYANVQLSDGVRVAVRASEERFRQIGWTAVREELEYYAEKGDMQMCAHLATIAPDELALKRERIEMFVGTYVELLERCRMHIQAAYIRKHCTVESVRATTQLHTGFSIACGRCKKPIEGSFRAQGSATGSIHNGLCRNCREGGARCSICRLPVLGLMILCPVCTHGGHQECVRKYYPHQPMRPITTDLPDTPILQPQSMAIPATSGFSLLSAAVPTRASSIVSTASTATSTTSTFFTANSDDKERPRDDSGSGQDKSSVLMGHPCAAGCGHYCWVADNRLSSQARLPIPVR